MRNLSSLVLLVLVGGALVGPTGCSCNGTVDTGGGGGDGGRVQRDGFGNNLDAFAVGLVVTPADVTIDVPPGGPAGMASFTATAMVNGAPQDVSGSATFFVEDSTLGTQSGRRFTSNTVHGGTTTLHVVWQNLQGSATIHVRLRSSVSTGCPGCPAFPDLNAMPCAMGTAPNLVYPPEGVLLPPNMNVLQVQFLAVTGATAYEVDFESSTVDLRVETKCNPILDTRGAATGGCSYDLDSAIWDGMAGSNRGAAPVAVTVRATTDGVCATGSNARHISFAEEDLHGGIYYWQSLVVGGVAGKTGGIYRYDFGSRGTQGEAFLTPATGSCVGCHFLSRDGQRMTYGTDDADSDDEYNDLSGHLLDVGAKKGINTSSPSGKPLPPGFQTFTHDHKKLLASQGQAGAAMTFLEYSGDTGGAPTGMAPTMGRGTQPDWSADDRSVVYVVPAKFADKFTPKPYGRPDDDHFVGGSLWTVGWDPASGMYGPSKVLITSMGENNYYPSFSPDSPASFVVFNRVAATAGATDLDNDAFNNPSAKVWLLSTKAGSTPIEAKRLNDADKLTNSWPRWSPFVQSYHHQKLLWITMSSTRDYGVKVRNHDQVSNGAGQMVDQTNCYPPDSPQNLGGSHQQPLPPNCNQPQIWMAAINLSTAEFGTDDPSYPAFWLPFQDVTSHNHIAQWVEQVVKQPPCGDAGACIAETQPCGGAACGVCCAGMVCQAPADGGASATCQMVIP